MSLDTLPESSDGTAVPPQSTGEEAELALEPRQGMAGQLAERINAVTALNERRTRELVRASRVIGREGRMTERLEVSADGDWGTGAAAVNSLIDDLVRPTTEVARVIAASKYVSKPVDLDRLLTRMRSWLPHADQA